MNHTPKRTNHHGLIASILFFVLALLCFIGSRYIPFYPGIFQFIGLTAAVAAILMIQKFCITTYLYCLTPPDQLHKSNKFTVIRTLGSRRTTLCKLNLNDCVALIPASRTDKTLKALSLKASERASFCPDLFPRNAYTLITEHDDEVLVVTFQCDEAYLMQIRSRLRHDITM